MKQDERPNLPTSTSTSTSTSSSSSSSSASTSDFALNDSSREIPLPESDPPDQSQIEEGEEFRGSQKKSKPGRKTDVGTFVSEFRQIVLPRFWYSISEIKGSRLHKHLEAHFKIQKPVNQKVIQTKDFHWTQNPKKFPKGKTVTTSENFSYKGGFLALWGDTETDAFKKIIIYRAENFWFNVLDGKMEEIADCEDKVSYVYDLLRVAYPEFVNSCINSLNNSSFSNSSSISSTTNFSSRNSTGSSHSFSNTNNNSSTQETENHQTRVKRKRKENKEDDNLTNNLFKISSEKSSSSNSTSSAFLSILPKQIKQLSFATENNLLIFSNEWQPFLTGNKKKNRNTILSSLIERLPMNLELVPNLNNFEIVVRDFLANKEIEPLSGDSKNETTQEVEGNLSNIFNILNNLLRGILQHDEDINSMLAEKFSLFRAILHLIYVTVGYQHPNMTRSISFHNPFMMLKDEIIQIWLPILLLYPLAITPLLNIMKILREVENNDKQVEGTPQNKENEFKISLDLMKKNYQNMGLILNSQEKQVIPTQPFAVGDFVQKLLQPKKIYLEGTLLLLNKLLEVIQELANVKISNNSLNL